MLTFKNYLTLSESTKDVYSAIGKSKGDSLLGTKVDPEVQKLHDKTFGAGVHHIEIPLANPVPDNVIEHVKSQGDSMEGNQVKLKSGRTVELSKYLPRAKAPKSVMDDHENWSRNKGSSNSKLVISRHPGEVASASTGTHWDSCANLKGHGAAAQVMHHELKHGTLIAQHVHAEAKPDEHGEYAAKDILGRALIKRHDSPEGNISYHREGQNYGAFPHVAKEAMDHFTDHHYPQTDELSHKHKTLYDDDKSTVKITKNANSDYLHNALTNKNHDIRMAALKHTGITSAHLDKTLDHKDEYTKEAAIQHPKITAAHIDKALASKDENFRRLAITHSNATAAHIDKALTDKDEVVRRLAITHPNATAAHIDKALSDKSEDVREAAIKHPNANEKHIGQALNDEDEYVRGAAVKHHKSTSAHMEKALSDKKEYVRARAAVNRHMTPAHIDKALDDSSNSMRSAAAAHANASAANLTKALNNKDEMTRIAAVKNPNSIAAHIDKAMNDVDPDVRVAAVKSPNATAAHIATALKDKVPFVAQAANARLNKK